jgi:uncharacterized protein
MPSSETFKQIDSDACFDRLYQILHEYEKEEKVLIAYSGGVDSGLLCDIAWECSGEKMIALLLTGPFIPQHEVDEAMSFARERRFPLLIREYDMLSFPDITENTKRRCAFCKQHMADLLWQVADEYGCSTIIDGVSTSDTAEYRPGIEVSTKAGIKHPFLECDITKAEIRDVARRRGLSLWNKPSSACLASRVPYGTPLTKDLLQLAETSERYLHEHGFSPVRVRIHNDIARIEIAPEQFQALIEMRKEIVSSFRELGILHVTLDMLGHRSGSMDESPPRHAASWREGPR